MKMAEFRTGKLMQYPSSAHLGPTVLWTRLLFLCIVSLAVTIFNVKPGREAVCGDLLSVCFAVPGLTVFEKTGPRPGDKRKRESRGDPGEVDGYSGEHTALQVFKQ